MSGTTPEILKYAHLARLLSGESIEVKGQWLEVQVPRFQRGYVWSENRRKALVGSIREGLPVGCIVLCKSMARTDDSGRVITTYQLVDGLQRSLTIAAATRNPYLWITEHQKIEEIVNQPALKALNALLSSATTASPKEFKGVVTGFLDLHQKDPAQINIGNLWDALRRDLGISRSAGPDDWKILGELIQSIAQAISIDEMEIPALLYTGPIENSPKIFELLNQQGQKLSPYQIYAAGWINDKVLFEAGKKLDESLLYFVHEREKSMQKAGYLLEGVREYSLFDALNALGHKWARKYPYFFSQTELGSESSIAFQMAALYYRVKTTDKVNMQRLPDKLPKKPDGTLDFNDFAEAIDRALKTLDQQIGRYLDFNFRAKHGKSDTSLLSDLQVVSVAVWLAHKLSENKAYKSGHLTRRLVIDAVNKNWEGGPIDATAFNNVWKSSRPSDPADLASIYEQKVSDEDWASELNRWFEGQMKERTRKRKSASKGQKIVLKLIASTNMNFAEEQDAFEIDHLFSVKACQNAFLSRDEEWPINAIANLGVLVVRSNREKSTKSILDWYETPAPSGAEKARDWKRRREQSLRSLSIAKKSLKNWDTSSLTEVSFMKVLRSYWSQQLAILEKI